jgi:hypothetical protein
VSGSGGPEWTPESFQRWVDLHKSHAFSLYARASWNNGAPHYLREELFDPGQRETTLFINSIGGFGDSVPVLLAMKLYRKYRPQDRLILYDSIFLNHYYDLSNFADVVVQASEHILPDYVPGWVASMDPDLPLSRGSPLAQLRAYGITKIVSTHHAHGRPLSADTAMLKMDIADYFVDSVLRGCLPFGLVPRESHMARIQGWIDRLRADGRLLIGLQNRANDPYGNLHVSGARYEAEIAELARILVERFNARVVLFGDAMLEDATYYHKGDWVSLNQLENNVYVKLEVMSRCDYMFGAPSGFSMIANFMRTTRQSGGIFLYSSTRILEDSHLSSTYPSYFQDGGGCNVAKVVYTYQDPLLLDFIFDIPHSPAKALRFLERVMAARRDTPSSFGMNVTRWMVPSCDSGDSEASLLDAARHFL